LENFTGKTSLSVYQDFHAKVFLKNLVHVLALPVQDAVDTDCHDRKYSYQINFTQALSKSKGVVALWLYESGRQIKRLIKELQTIFQITVEPDRPGRKYPRNHKIRARKYFQQYKPIG